MTLNRQFFAAYCRTFVAFTGIVNLADKASDVRLNFIDNYAVALSMPKNAKSSLLKNFSFVIKIVRQRIAYCKICVSIAKKVKTG